MYVCMGVYVPMGMCCVEECLCAHISLRSIHIFNLAHCEMLGLAYARCGPSCHMACHCSLTQALQWLCLWQLASVESAKYQNCLLLNIFHANGRLIHRDPGQGIKHLLLTAHFCAREGRGSGQPYPGPVGLYVVPQCPQFGLT